MSGSEIDLVAQVLAAFRRAHVAGSAEPVVTVADLDAIWHDADQRWRFVDQLENRLNDPDLRRKIALYIEAAALRLESDAKAAERKMEKIDRTAAPISIALLAGGTVQFAISGTLAAGPLGLLIGGATGLVLYALRRDRLKFRVDDHIMSARRLRLLSGK